MNNHQETAIELAFKGYSSHVMEMQRGSSSITLVRCGDNPLETIIEDGKEWTLKKSHSYRRINRIVYEIMQTTTVQDADSDGLNNVAQLMRENNHVAMLLIRRPRGRVTFFVYVDAYGFYSKPIRL